MAFSPSGSCACELQCGSMSLVVSKTAYKTDMTLGGTPQVTP